MDLVEIVNPLSYLAAGSTSCERGLCLSHHQLLVFWTHLLALFVTARLLGALAKKLNLPSVIGELSAGVVLGPTLLGNVWPDAFDWFLPQSGEQSPMLLAVSWFGAAFLLVSAGFETDLDLIKRLGRAAVLVTIGSMVLPFVGGLAVGNQMPESFFGPEANRLVFTLFIAATVAISALAVVAKILGDLNLLRRDVGQITIAAGMANDLIGWVILGVIAGLAGSGVSLGQISQTVGGLVVFLALALTVGQRAIDFGLRYVRRNGRNLPGALTVSVLAMLVFGVITQAIGVEAVLGAFVAGVVLARSRYQQIESEHVIEDLTSVVFAPLFFATAGLRLDLALIRGDALKWAAILLAVALVLKFIGSYFGAKLAGLTSREGMVLGAGLNARGALEIIIATIGLSLSVFNQTTFTIIVMIPLVTSLLSSIAVRLLSRNLEGSVAERERLAREEALEKNLLVRNTRVLIPSAAEENSIVAAQIAHLVWPIELGATVMAINKGGETPSMEPVENILFGRKVDFADIDVEDSAASVAAQSKLGYGAIAVGASEVVSQGHYVSSLVDELLTTVDIPVVIVRKALNLPDGRLPGIFAQALVPVVASSSSRAAQELAANLSSNLGTRLMLSHILYREKKALVGASGLFGQFRSSAFGEPDTEVAERVLAQAHTHVASVGATVDNEIRFAQTPAEEIVRHATEIDADLIVVGAQLRKLDDAKPSLGPNVEHVLEHAPQTVAVVVMPDSRPTSGERTSD